MTPTVPSDDGEPGGRRIVLRLDRAQVRGHVVDANDGIIATAGVVEGLLGAGAAGSTVVLGSLAAMVGGAIALGGMKYSEAADERDARSATIEAERHQLDSAPEEELAELTGIYEAKGLSPDLARAVAEQLSEHDALAAHAEMEHGIDVGGRDLTPLFTATLAGVAFVIGSAVPLLMILVAPAGVRIPATFVAVVLALGITATIVATLGGARMWRTIVRTVSLGLVTMLLTLVGGTLIGL
ncbi:membrane protein [Pseudonocardia sulfidoxydans NBRC 16205]|uniref:Membrane protein n=1 Tax=Pseudonocardia sulfidoxydans NBRC 16205 TaxID=1223511 RepID=A0A511DIG4_9PSEU|nr:VIT1/CCC1 transporter family protein [Pseudonocardia sulfidoxydans]GEL23554.1 membrane protein [Pseudonocardia sulfidoxydans NBRC 16205]